MSKEAIHSDSAPAAIGTYSQAIKTGNLVFLSGQIPLDPATGEFVDGDFFSIADIAIWPWASHWEGQQQSLEDKPHMARWLDTVGARPGVKAGRAVAAELRSNLQTDKKAQDLLIEQGSK